VGRGERRIVLLGGPSDGREASCPDVPPAVLCTADPVGHGMAMLDLLRQGVTPDPVMPVETYYLTRQVDRRGRLVYVHAELWHRVTRCL